MLGVFTVGHHHWCGNICAHLALSICQAGHAGNTPIHNFYLLPPSLFRSFHSIPECIPFAKFLNIESILFCFSLILLNSMRHRFACSKQNTSTVPGLLSFFTDFQSPHHKVTHHITCICKSTLKLIRSSLTYGACDELWQTVSFSRCNSALFFFSLFKICEDVHVGFHIFVISVYLYKIQIKETCAFQF